MSNLYIISLNFWYGFFDVKIAFILLVITGNSGFIIFLS
nr:MAG TPA: hypothetical protein [Caudoviricetes sp.]